MSLTFPRHAGQAFRPYVTSPSRVDTTEGLTGQRARTVHWHLDALLIGIPQDHFRFPSVMQYSSVTSTTTQLREDHFLQSGTSLSVSGLLAPLDTVEVPCVYRNYLRYRRTCGGYVEDTAHALGLARSNA